MWETVTLWLIPVMTKVVLSQTRVTGFLSPADVLPGPHSLTLTCGQRNPAPENGHRQLRRDRLWLVQPCQCACNASLIKLTSREKNETETQQNYKPRKIAYTQLTNTSANTPFNTSCNTTRSSHCLTEAKSSLVIHRGENLALTDFMMVMLV